MKLKHYININIKLLDNLMRDILWTQFDFKITISFKSLIRVDLIKTMPSTNDNISSLPSDVFSLLGIEINRRKISMQDNNITSRTNNAEYIIYSSTL